MTDNKKILTVNPSDFSLPGNIKKTRKRTTTNSNGMIKMKPPKMPKRNETLRKKALLRMIRSQQQRNLDEITQKKTGDAMQNKESYENTASKENIKEGFHSSFNKATSYLDNLISESKTTNPNIKLRNHTIKNHLYEENVPRLNTEDLAKKPINNRIPDLGNLNPPTVTDIPKYGCLKNGNLPTYRSWLNKTKYNKPPLQFDTLKPNNLTPSNFSASINQQPDKYTHINSVSPNNEYFQQANINLNQQSGIDENAKVKLRGQKQKKRIVRTHKIGRSKYYSKIGVLISNKTIRNKVVTQKQQLKRVPIRDVRQHLIKQGFIKIGSDTPSDVLREMYESTMMICGEVKNNNTHNLLHNFIHATDE